MVMKYGHIGPCSLEYLLWDDIGEDLAMKFIYIVCCYEMEIGICVFFYFYNYVCLMDHG